MIDPTAHIDPLWPASAEEPSRLVRSPEGVLTVDSGQEEAIPAAVLDHRAEVALAPPPVLTLSKSEIGVLRRCPRRYQYEYEMGRTPAAGPGVEAEWGTALHRGLEVWYQGMKEAAEMGVMPTMTLAIESICYAALTPADDYTPPTDPYARAALRAMLRAYVAVWGPSDADQYEVVSVELPFDLPVLTAAGKVSRNYKEGARREGRIDAVVRERVKCKGCDGTGGVHTSEPCTDCLATGRGQGDGDVWLVEHKSTGKPPAEERFYTGLELELQPSLYFDAARELGLAPAGVLYDVVRRPDFDDPKPPPQRNKDGSERKAPSQQCPDCIDGTICTDSSGYICPTCSGTGRVSKQVVYSNPRYGEPAADYEERVYRLATEKPVYWFARRELTFEPWQIEESREDVRAAAREIGAHRRAGYWPRVGDRYVCGARGMVCPWLDVCGKRASADDDKLFPLKKKGV